MGNSRIVCSNNPFQTQLPVKLEASAGLSCNQWRASESATGSVGVLRSGSSSQVCHGLTASSASLLEPTAVSLPVLSPGTQSNPSVRPQLYEGKAPTYLCVVTLAHMTGFAQGLGDMKNLAGAQ